MTAKTSTQLKNTSFQAGQSAGQIGQDDLIDFVDSIPNLAQRYNAKNYGAIGDGSTHPLSGITLFHGQNTTGFTLAQWQAFFPFATATSNELDWCAHKQMFTVANGAGGGRVYSPVGVYRFNQQLVLPNATEPGNATPGGSLIYDGDGDAATIWQWSADLGSGQFAILASNRLNSAFQSYGLFTNICLVGPNAIVAYGSTPANMHGFGWQERLRVERVTIIGFRGGFCFPSGEQTRIIEVNCTNNFYGLYCDTVNSPPGYADVSFERCVCTQNKKAAVGCANDCEIAAFQFIKCFFGTSPYAFFKETGGSQPRLMEECKFIHCQFENIGNEVMSDGLAAGSHVATIAGTVEFDFCEFGNFNSTFGIAANPKTGMIALSHSYGMLHVRYPVFPAGQMDFSGFGITNGIFEIDFFNCITLEGDLDAIFSNMLGTCPIGRASSFASTGAFRLINTGVWGWKGEVRQANGNPTLVVGDVVTCSSSGDGLVALSAGNATEQVVGIVALPHRASGGMVCVINQGYAPVVNARANVIANGSWCRAAASGTAITSTGLFQTTSRNLGMWGNASGTTPNFVGSVFLQGLV